MVGRRAQLVAVGRRPRVVPRIVWLRSGAAKSPLDGRCMRLTMRWVNRLADDDVDAPGLRLSGTRIPAMADTLSAHGPAALTTRSARTANRSSGDAVPGR